MNDICNASELLNTSMYADDPSVIMSNSSEFGIMFTEHMAQLKYISDH